MRFSGKSTARWTYRNFSISNPKPGPQGQTSCRGRPYDRPCRARPRNAFPNPAYHGKSRAAKTPLLPARRDSGSKEELSHATTRQIFQSRSLDRGGKLLTVGGHMITFVKRGREMPSPIQLFTENLAKRKLLSFPPPGLRVERGAFSGNIKRDIPKLGFEFVFSAVTLSYALLLSLIHISEPTRLLSISY